jgi:hypothetical protein
MNTRSTNGHHDGYVSEFTAFIEDYLARHPEVRAAQERHRRQLWDVEVDFDELARAQADSLPQPPYVYFDNPRPRPPKFTGRAEGADDADGRLRQSAANDESDTGLRRAA